MTQNLDVFLWNRKVGTLVAYKEKYAEKTCFYFDSDFIKSGYDIAPLQAPINGVFAQRGLPVYAEDDKVFGGLPSFNHALFSKRYPVSSRHHDGVAEAYSFNFAMDFVERII